MTEQDRIDAQRQILELIIKEVGHIDLASRVTVVGDNDEYDTTVFTGTVGNLLQEYLDELY